MDHDDLTTACTVAAPLGAGLAVRRDVPGLRAAVTAGAVRFGGASRCRVDMTGIEHPCGRPAAPGDGM